MPDSQQRWWCSGCVTSAETVLLQHQSTEEFQSKLADPSITVVISISPQSRASLAVYYGLSPVETMLKLTGFFKSLGVALVYDTAASRDLALLETAHEFIHRCRVATAQVQGSNSMQIVKQGPTGVSGAVFPLSVHCECWRSYVAVLHALLCSLPYCCAAHCMPMFSHDQRSP
jgi:iron only hydrogenase large subunit-like protein